MSRYLVSTTETYRVDSEAEAQTLIQENKNINYGELVKYSSTYRERKQKGEVVDSWYRVILTKSITDEKEPDGSVEIQYNRASAF